MKIFLSHSSKDKDIVEQVYKEIGPSLCHYDTETFDKTSFLPDQIFSTLSECTHFVLFASASALNSDWVKGELQTVFISWMRTSLKQAMIFLIDDGDRNLVPTWLQNYVIIEHPSPKHIACRILSGFDEWEKQQGKTPPFYRYSEITSFESSVTVEANKLPVALMVCGPDGYGRKQIINELYSRRFPGIAKRKLLLAIDVYESEVDLYRYLIGLKGLISPIELARTIKEFIKDSQDIRYEKIAESIKSSTNAGQAIILDVGASGLDDNGNLVSWLDGILQKLSTNSHPGLIILSARTPPYLTHNQLNRINLQKLLPLPTAESRLLFSWWLNSLKVEQSTTIVNDFIDMVEGRPKSIEIAARILSNIDHKNISRQKSRISDDLKSQAAELLKGLSNNRTVNLSLALVAYSGYISEVDLISALRAIPGETPETIEKALDLLHSYGFLIQDSISLKLPAYLVRAARALLQNTEYSEQIKHAWESLISDNGELDQDGKTSVSFINDHCLSKLRSGSNTTIGIESLILPSQCFRLGRTYYDSGDYKRAFELCEMAYRNRLALTEESALEALRFKGLSAARLNKKDELNDVLNCFSSHKKTSKRDRIHSFIKGFNHRLDGNFDSALNDILEAYNYKGDGDIHILRELSFLHYSSGDLNSAKKYITNAIAKTDNNSYIIEMWIRVELAFGENHIEHNKDSIERAINELEELHRGKHGQYGSLIRAEYHFATNNSTLASTMIDEIKSTGLAAQVLRSKILIKNKKFIPAKAELLRIKKNTLNSTEGQRQSALPSICELIVECASAISTKDGIQELGINKKYMPMTRANKWKEILRDNAAFDKIQLSSTEKALINA